MNKNILNQILVDKQPTTRTWEMLAIQKEAAASVFSESLKKFLKWTAPRFIVFMLKFIKFSS